MRSRIRDGLVGLVSLLFVSACAKEHVLTRHLWPEEAAWTRIDGGWAQAVSLHAPRTLHARGEQFRAVAFPALSSGVGPTVPTVRIEIGEGFEEIRVAGPTAIDVEVRGPVRLESSHPVSLLRPRLVGHGRRGKRIFLAVADTLRFDHATPELMPEVWKYFEGGSRYLHAYSPASWTLPSLAAVFTGQSPARLRSPDGTLISLSPETETIATGLAAQGYLSVAATANYTVNHENGFSAGFDLFFAPRPGGAASDQLPDAREIEERLLRAAAWFEDQDLFLYAQLMEPHEPYRDHENGRVLTAPARDSDPSREVLAALRAAYASEVRYLSRRLGNLLRGLGELELAIFTADHGEEFYEHRGFGHGPTLYDEVVRVPLWIRGAAIPESTIAEPVSLVALKDLLLGTAADLHGPRVHMETFSFGPPRWSCVLDHKRLIYAAARLLPEADEHPITAWLRRNHPRLTASALDGQAIVLDEATARRSIGRLIEHFAGFRQGTFVLLQGGHDYRLAVAADAVSGGVVWGDAANIDVSETAAGALRIQVETPRPFTMLFLEVADIPIVDLASQREIPVTIGAPRRLPPAGITAWYDAGRPAAELQGTEETLERLRALGYI